MKCCRPLKTIKILVPACHKIAISTKVIPLIHFDFSSWIAWIFGIFYQNIQKVLFISQVSKNFKMLPAPSKNFADPPKKIGGKNGPLLSFATKYSFQATYYLNVEAISFRIGRGRRSRLISYS